MSGTCRRASLVALLPLGLVACAPSAAPAPPGAAREWDRAVTSAYGR